LKAITMAASKKTKPNKMGMDILLEKGVLLAGAGLAVLLSPFFFSSVPVLKSVAMGIRTMGWPLIALGLVLVAVHFVMKSRATQAVDAPVPHSARCEPAMLLTQRTPATAWSPAVFAAIEWRRFEAVCEALFAQAGFGTRAQSHGADGGVDIWLHSANAQGPVGVVQCKHWQGKPVGVKEMREFFGVMASHKLQRGTYATTSTYTADAKLFAKDNSINALDGPALLALIAKRTPEQQQALLGVAYEGDYWRPTCASCGTKMVERTPGKGGAAFWGCASYPKCRRTLQMAS
jgi:restriction system protein